MDQGIINAEKIKYKRQVVRRKLDAIEYGYELEPITILEAIEYTDIAWKDVKQSTIANCFKKAGYKLANQREESPEEIDNIVNEDEDLVKNRKQFFDQWEQLIKAKTTVIFPDDFSSAQEFLNIDKDLPSFGTLTDEEILAQVANNDTEQNEENDEEEQNPIVQTKVTNEDFKKAFETMKLFLYQQDVDSSKEIHHLNKIHEYFEDVA
jgi:hypothetical protein